jgi:hypothetical protein
MTQQGKRYAVLISSTILKGQLYQFLSLAISGTNEQILIRRRTIDGF